MRRAVSCLGSIAANVLSGGSFGTVTITGFTVLVHLLLFGDTASSVVADGVQQFWMILDCVLHSCGGLIRFGGHDETRALYFQ